MPRFRSPICLQEGFQTLILEEPDLPLDCQTYTELVTVVDTCETEKNTRGKTKIIFKMFKWSKNDLINKKHTKQQKSTIILIPRSSTLYDILLVNTKWSWFFDNVLLPLCYFFPKMIIYIYYLFFYLIMIFLLHNYY